MRKNLSVNDPKHIVVFQTAFLGDVILTLPMVQLLHQRFPAAEIDVVTTPKAAELLMNHPAVTTIIKYDKRNAQKGLKGIAAMAVFLNKRKYDLAVAPHRSFRTSLILALSGIKERIGFSTAAGRFLYNHVIRYKNTLHEIDRNISLLLPLEIKNTDRELPSLHPSTADGEYIGKFLLNVNC